MVALTACQDGLHCENGRGLLDELEHSPSSQFHHAEHSKTLKPDSTNVSRALSFGEQDESRSVSCSEDHHLHNGSSRDNRNIVLVDSVNRSSNGGDDVNQQHPGDNGSLISSVCDQLAGLTTLSEEERTEPILTQNDARFCLLSIRCALLAGIQLRIPESQADKRAHGALQTL